MRVIGTVPHDSDARKLCNYLQKFDIQSSSDVQFFSETGAMSYQIWIHDEDRIEEAQKIYHEFLQNPQDVKYEIAEPVLEEDAEVSRPPNFRYQTHLTVFIILFCVFLFFFNTLEQKPSEQMTPLQKEFLYDVPNFEGPYWKGLYNWSVAKLTGVNPASGEGPLFTDIRKGEVWRLVTPIFLHYDLLHILFNMLWLWVLGRPIEQRIGPLRLLIFTLAAAIFANTLQYLMSGPLFIGYSGVVMAMAGFIWMREKVAPWEGYPVTRGTIFFLILFISAIFLLQAASFFLTVFTTHSFSPNIANSAHIGGALFGSLMGRLRFFSQRTSA